MFTDLPYTPVVPYESSGSDNLHTLSVGGGRNSFRVDKQGLSLGSKDFKTAPFRSDMDGNVTMNNADIRGTISGRNTDTIAQVITANGNIVTEKMDFESGKILKEFTFSGYEGAFKSGNVEWNKKNGNITAGSGVIMNQNGIIGAKGGRPTFTLNNNGDATFSGTLTAPNGTLGVVTAGEIRGVNIEGSLIIGTSIKSAKKGARAEMSSGGVFTTVDTNNTERIKIQREQLVLYDQNGRSAGYFYGNSPNTSGFNGNLSIGGNVSVLNIQGSSASFNRLTINGEEVQTGRRQEYTPPWNMLKYVRHTQGALILETQGGQRFTIYATIGG